MAANGLCKCCGLWLPLRMPGRCRECAMNLAKRGACRHKNTSSGAVFVGQDRREFYMNRRENPIDPAHEWHGIDDYLEAAITAGSSDKLLEFLDGGGVAVDVVSALELHHQQHGAIAWNECPDRECWRLGLACAEITVEAIRGMAG